MLNKDGDHTTLRLPNVSMLALSCEHVLFCCLHFPLLSLSACAADLCPTDRTDSSRGPLWWGVTAYSKNIFCPLCIFKLLRCVPAQAQAWSRHCSSFPIFNEKLIHDTDTPEGWQELEEIPNQRQRIWCGFINAPSCLNHCCMLCFILTSFHFFHFNIYCIFIKVNIWLNHCFLFTIYLDY